MSRHPAREFPGRVLGLMGALTAALAALVGGCYAMVVIR